LRILIVTPRQPTATGNHMTAWRHCHQLRSRGHVVHLIEADDNPEDLNRESVLFRPDIVHLLHAYRSGKPWLSSALTCAFPMVVTLTGTDIHHGVRDTQQAPVIEEVLRRAGAILIQNPLTFESLKETRGIYRERLHFLPPGVILGTDVFSPRALLELPPEVPLFLHPAGIRPVKANLELLRSFDPLAEGIPLRVAFCGPVLDPEYGRRFFSALEERPWASYLGVIPPAAIPSALMEADVILNHSESEGMSTTLMEAAVLGRPILARDIPGNAAVVREGENGFLYRTALEFLHRARMLHDDPELRRRLGQPHSELYRPEIETDELESVYREVLHRA
jgi:L-malate glycosyltransferase